MSTVRGLERASIAGAIVVLGAAFPIFACTDGATPDCSLPEAGCGPDNAGGGEDDATIPIEASRADGAIEADTSTKPSGDGGASTDADASHD